MVMWLQIDMYIIHVLALFSSLRKLLEIHILMKLHAYTTYPNKFQRSIIDIHIWIWKYCTCMIPNLLPGHVAYSWLNHLQDFSSEVEISVHWFKIYMFQMKHIFLLISVCKYSFEGIPLHLV